MKELKWIETLLEEKRYKAIHEELRDENPADLAGLLEALPIEKAVLVFRLLPKDMEAETFANLYSDVQQEIIQRLSAKEIFSIMEELFIDDAVDFIEEMPATIAKKVLANATPETRQQINQLLKYPENSAGSIMTVEYVDLKRKMTVSEAFDRIRKIGLDKETIYTCYVTDSRRHLEGIVSVKTLLLSDPAQRIMDIMDTNMIVTDTLNDREEVAYMSEKYDLLNVPVVDSEKRLVGIITIDDIIDVVQEEATEDFEKMAAMLPSEKPYLKSSVLELSKNRIVWLMVLMASAMVTGGILSVFESAIAVMPVLVTFIPMLTDTGGNAGSQSATMVIRGMALKEIALRDFLRVMWKEIRIGLLVGASLSAVNFARIWIMYRNDPTYMQQSFQIAATVSICLLFTAVLAKLVGGSLPLLAKRCKIDPAIMAAPLITTIVDALALLMFFGLSVIVFGL